MSAFSQKLKYKVADPSLVQIKVYWEVFNRIFRIPTIFHFIPILYDVGPVNLFTPKNSKIENIHLMLHDSRQFPHTSN